LSGPKSGRPRRANARVNLTLSRRPTPCPRLSLITPQSALAAPGDDRELLRLCNELHQLLRIDDALPSDDLESFFLLRNLCEAAADRIMAVRPRTDAGRKAQARVHLNMLEKYDY